MDATEKKAGLFQYLDGVLERNQKKASNRKNRNAIASDRIIIQAVNAYGKLLELEELEALRVEVDELREEVKNRK